MKKALYIDCCLRKNSRTKDLADTFINELAGYEIEHLILEDEDLKPLVGDFLESRQVLLENNELNHPRFRYAYQFRDADLIIIAAPFWDLSFPALLKIYIENISLDGITFTSTENGLIGLCKASDMVYLTTRGGVYKYSEMEQATPYLKQLCPFFGIDNFHCIAADGMDICGYDHEASLNKAKQDAIELARTL